VKNLEQPQSQQSKHNQCRDNRERLFFLRGEFEEHGNLFSPNPNTLPAQVEEKMRAPHPITCNSSRAAASRRLMPVATAQRLILI